MPTPKQKPHRSKQDYLTPPEFLNAVEKRFGRISIDLAATKKNRVAYKFISPKEDSLSVEWNLRNSIGWLNPDFMRLPLWSKKCLDESRKLGPKGVILLLSPASIGANWFSDFVWNYAEVYALNGRITFVGESAPYPKDCILSVYSHYPKTFFNTWNWRD